MNFMKNAGKVMSGRGFPRSWNGKIKAASLTGAFTFNADTAALGFDKLFDNREAQTAARVFFAGMLNPEKLTKNIFLVPGFKSDT